MNGSSNQIARALTFPNRTVGRVYVRRFSAEDWLLTSAAHSWQEWTLHRLATGEVDIPEDHAVTLITALPAAHDLGFLRTLSPDAIDVLQVFAPEIRRGDLDPIGALTGLRVLVVAAGEIAVDAFAGLELPEGLTTLGVSAGRPSPLRLGGDGRSDLQKLRLRNIGVAFVEGRLFDRVDELTLASDQAMPASGAASDDFSWWSRLARLRRVYFRVPSADPNAVDWPLLSSLEHLTLQVAGIDQQTLERVGGLPVLKTLNLEQPPELGAFQALERFTGLTDLSCQGGLIDATDLDAIASVPHLRLLSLNAAEISAGIERLGRARGLEHLDLSGSTFEPTLETRVSLERLTGLDLSETAIENGFLDRIADGNSLVVLRVRGCRALDNDVVATVARHRRLEELDVSGTTIDPGTLARQVRFAALDRLALGELNVGPDVASLVDASTIHDLDLTGAKVKSGALRAIGGLHALETLGLSGATVPASELSHLSTLRNLTSLTLPDGAGSLDWLGALPAIASLSVAAADIDETLWRAVGHIPSLRVLRTDAAVVSMERNGEAPLSLELLHLTRARFSDAAAALARVRSSSRLHELDLSFSNVDVSALSEISGHPVLRRLGVYDVRDHAELVARLREMPALDLVWGWLSSIDERFRARAWEPLPWCWTVYPARDP